MQKRIVIAIDGPAGAGKSTVARTVADRLGFPYINTGAMYRAIALWALRTGVRDDDMHRLEQLALEADIRFEPGSRKVLLNGEDITQEIRLDQVSDSASRVSTVPAVRRALVDKQRQLGANSSVVMEGRDIGTVVFPDAEIKVFLDADPLSRARRRVEEMVGAGVDFNPEQTMQEMAQRDERDRSRSAAPLIQAPDAVYIDSTALTVEQVVEHILKLVRDRTANGKEYSR